MSAQRTSQFSTYLFVVVLCALCGFSLATISSLLKETQERALIIDQSKQMLMAAKIIHPKGYFVKQGEKDLSPATYDAKEKKLIFSTEKIPASEEHITEIFNNRLIPKLVNEQGQLYTFEKAGLELNSYIQENQDKGYARLKDRLIYEIRTEGMDDTLGYLVPVNGFGLWGPIYGYLAIEKNGQRVKGISWYKHKETPGLGAGISEAWWQEQFIGKLIFQAPNPGEAQNFDVAPLGINVVRGKVIDVYGSGPKSKNSVDGMSGATITGNGVTKAYKDSLAAYRQFLIKLAKQHS